MRDRKYNSSPTILIVDDFEAERYCYRRYLSRLPDYSPHFMTAETGDDAYALYCVQKPDIVLLEYSLPDTEAPILLEKLSDAPRAQQPPVVVMIEDCQAASTMAMRALRAGAYSCLIKETLSSVSLQKTIRRALSEVPARFTPSQPTAVLV